jgi:oligogalacturonide lyase
MSEQSIHYLQRLRSERETYTDQVSGVLVNRLTQTTGHSHSLYFTNDSWTHDYRYLICASERSGIGNQLFAVELASGDLLQLTDLHGDEDIPHIYNYAALSPIGQHVVLWYSNTLWRLDLIDGSLFALWQCPDGYRVHGTSVNADGSFVFTSISQDLSHRFGARDGTNIAAEQAYHQAKPHSRVMAISMTGTNTGNPAGVLWEEAYPITHVNASPTDPDLMVFCHEGPWLAVDQRMWGLRLSDPTPWPILPRVPEWGVGHEFWHADGKTIGYHARFHQGTWRHAAGFVTADNTEAWQAELNVPTQHAVALHRDWMILDGTREGGEYLLLVQREGNQWAPARILAQHHCSRHHSRAHVHARLRSDGKQLVYTSDKRTYSDVYLIDIPDDKASLPLWSEKPFRYYWQ